MSSVFIKIIKIFFIDRTAKIRNALGQKTLKEQGFYHSPIWRKTRLLVLQRDHYLCQHCLAKGIITKATEVHHIKPLADYPWLALKLENLISLCWQCHEKTKNKKQIKLPKGVRVIKP